MKKFLGLPLMLFLSCPVWAGTPLECIEDLPEKIQFGKTYDAGTVLRKMGKNVINHEKVKAGAGYVVPYMNSACVVSVHIFKAANEAPAVSYGKKKTVSFESVTDVRNYSVKVYSTCSAMFRRESNNQKLVEATTLTVEKAVLDPLKSCLR